MSESRSLEEQQRRDAQTLAAEATTPPPTNTRWDEPVPSRPGNVAPRAGNVAPTLAGDLVPGQIHTREQFAQCLSLSGLMTADELRTIDDSLPPDQRPSDANSLAELLIRRRKLTEYQANLLRLGQTKGLVFGNYVVVDKLGEGGMGVVFKAQHRRMKRTVALKVLPGDLTNSPDALARFHREVEAAAKLTHPHIAAAYDADEANGVHFLVMEYVDGANLSQTIKANGPLPLGQALNYVLQTARGLNHAHVCGVVHRDIKPGNLLLDKAGTVKILDMGLARFDGPGDDGNTAAAELTQSGRVMGTVDYMAPEQALDAKHADHRADIYSLGCTLFYLLTGRPLSPDGTLTHKLLWHQTESVPDLSSICPAAGPKLDAAFKRMLAKKPADRQQSMGEVIHELESCLVELSPEDAAAAVSGPMATGGTESTLNQYPRSSATVVERPTVTYVAGQPVAAVDRAPPKRRWPVLVGTFGIVAAGLVAAAVVLNNNNNDNRANDGNPTDPAVAEGTLVHLTIDQPGATVLLDDQVIPIERGLDKNEEHRSLPLKVGKKYRIKVTKPGFEEYVQNVTAAKQQENLQVALKAVAGPIVPNSVPPKTLLLRWVFANGGSATLLLGQTTQTVEVVRANEVPSGAFSIKAVKLDGAMSLKEDELSQLSAADGLQSLSLKGAAIGDRAAEELAKIKGLWSLDLSQTKITDLGLAKLAALPELRDLNLQKTMVGDDGVTGIGKLPRLENLFLTDTQVTDRGLLQLVGLEELHTVALNGTKVTLTGVDGIKAALPKLKITWDAPDVEREIARKVLNTGAAISLVSLEGKAIGEVRKAADLPVERFQIQSIDWSNKVKITDADLAQLSALPKLQLLNLDGTSVTADGLAKLPALKALKVVDLGSLQVPDAAVDALKAGIPGGDVRWTPNNERLVAKWVLEQQGTVDIATPDGETITKIDDPARLPNGRFSLTAVRLDGNEKLADADLRRFKGFTRLETLSLNNTAIGDAGLNELATCTAIRDVSLNNTKVTDPGLAVLGRFGSLRLLLLGGTAITDRGLEQLNNVRQLTDLSLQKTKITDDGLLLLVRFTSLNRLSLADTPLTDAALPQLSKLAGVTQLFLSGTSISDAGIEELSVALPKCKVSGNPPNPQRLALRWILSQGGTASTTGGEVRKPAELPRGPVQLTKIDLGGLSKVTGDMLVKISLCTGITELDLSGTNVNDEALKSIAAMSELTKLNLAATRVSDAGLAQLKPLVKLKWLSLQGTRITGAELSQLSGLAELDYLSLDGARINDRNAANLAKFTALTSLNLNDNTSLGDKGLGQLAELTKLQTLGLRGTNVGDPGMATLAKFADLQNLDLSSTAVTDAGTAQLKGLANLKTLYLYGTTVGDGTLTALAGLKNLRVLNVAKTKVTDGAIATLKTAVPDLRVSKSEARADPDNPPTDGGTGGPRERPGILQPR